MVLIITIGYLFFYVDDLIETHKARFPLYLSTFLRVPPPHHHHHCGSHHWSFFQLQTIGHLLSTGGLHIPFPLAIIVICQLYAHCPIGFTSRPMREIALKLRRVVIRAFESGLKLILALFMVLKNDTEQTGAGSFHSMNYPMSLDWLKCPV